MKKAFSENDATGRTGSPKSGHVLRILSVSGVLASIDF